MDVNAKLADRITAVLAPELGENTADSVARHLCAKHGIDVGPVDPEKVIQLKDTIRRGLVAFVGPERADQLAERCFADS